MISTPVGSGITLERSPQSLEPVLNQVIAELRTSSLERKIATNFDLTQAVNCDGGRIAQLFSNLLGNSISHGTAARPIQVQARTHDGAFELSVANSGQPIPAEAMDRLFQPFYRVSAQEAPQGLGLGLYIVSEIARAWRKDRRDVIAARDAIHVPDAALGHGRLKQPSKYCGGEKIPLPDDPIQAGRAEWGR